MRRYGSLVLVGILTATAGCDGSAGDTTALQRALSADVFVTRAGPELRIGSTPFYYAGTNNYYLWYYPFDCTPTSPVCVREILDDSVAMGLTVIRTWGFGDGGGTAGWNGYAFQPSPGVYGDATFAHFDQVVAEAKARGLRLVIPLVNNWDDFGGMDQYVAWTGGTTHDDFYTLQACKDLYKAYVAHFLNHVSTLSGVAYKDEPAIMAWELANEPRAQTAGVAVLDGWINEMSAYIHSIDARHLVSTGEEGFYNGRTGFSGYVYGGAQGTDFIANNAHPGIDLVTMHLYPDAWNLADLDALDWINVHVDDARYALGKPVMLGEFGKTASTTADTAVRDALYTDWYHQLEMHNANGDNFWILYGNAYQNYDKLGVYYPGDTSTVAVIENHSGVMNARIGQNTVADEVALTETAGAGTVAGSYQATRAADGVTEVLTEVLSSGSPKARYSNLSWTYRLWVTKGDTPVFKVRAWKSGGNDGDNFQFQYSTDNVSFTSMLTVSKTADDGQYQTFVLPTGVREKVWIRVVDTDHVAGHQALDSLFIDHMTVEVTGIALSTDMPPTVAISAPANGAAVAGVVAISANATDDVGLAAVEYSIDGGAYVAMTSAGGGVWTASWDASAQPQGSTHTIGVRATDTASQIAVASVSVHIDNFPGDPDPTASISAPADGSTVKGTVTINATATDDTAVAAVQYRIDGGSWIAMGLVSGNQWSGPWDSTTVADGFHQIGVQSIDNVGQPSPIATVTVRVANVSSLIVHIQNIAMSGKLRGGQRQAEADVLIWDVGGTPASGVSVTVAWSGVGPAKTETVITGANGVASSFSNKGGAGTYVATVTAVSCSSCTYDSSANVETSDSVTIP